MPWPPAPVPPWWGAAESGRGVVGANNQNGVGVWGETSEGRGVVGVAKNGDGTWGECDSGRGVVGVSKTGTGVWGATESGRAVVGANNQKGIGVWGETSEGRGVVGVAKNGDGTWGECDSGRGVVGVSKTGAGVWGETTGGRGVVGVSESDIGVFGKGGRLAGFFEGDVEVTGDIRLTNADCAEDFNIGGEVKIEPGTVMVLCEENTLFPSRSAYDKRVAGVVSGAGEYKPGIVLDKQTTDRNRQPIALLGKVYCKVDAQFGAIEVGDLLTTSNTSGHAMKVSDSLKASGSIIGKALRSLREGQGMIPILVALQ